ncbi:Y-family DNA polymerase [Marinomonas balearica]|uniref:Protein ImuB n=1 Tax=Marinomonas balearica TaxID=491947 RepID=A0A4R6M7X7_9GAMM|nr:DNA polymerase Y family protein [Marinomonas balearica]TDO96740.1 protein ImuB [Marinomonas balearica]
MWMAFYFPQLSLEALDTNGCGNATALINRQKSKLILCNQQARATGLKEGMSLSLAYTLNPDLQLREKDARAEWEQLEILALCLNQFSATVCISPPRAILIEVATMLQYFGSVSEIENKARQALNTWSENYIIGFAKTGKLALWRALSKKPLLPDKQWQNLDEEVWIQDILIKHLDWSSKHIQRLQGMGFNTLNSLYRLPTSLLRRHLGVGLYTQFGQALGLIKEPLTPYHAPETFKRERLFEYEVESTLALLFPLKSIIQSMCLFLQRRRQWMYAFEITLTLAWSTNKAETSPVIRIQHDLGSDSAPLWLELTELKLTRLTLTAPVRSMRVDIVKMEQSEEESGDLFNNFQQQTRDQNLFISRLQARLGEQSIQTPKLTNEHLPEQAMRFLSVSLIEQKAKGGSSLRKLSRNNDLAHRPAWQTKKPEQITPNQFQILEGPERISSAWWLNNNAVHSSRRDYYIARWFDGRKAWVFRNDLGTWYLHGWFG